MVYKLYASLYKLSLYCIFMCVSLNTSLIPSLVLILHAPLKGWVGLGDEANQTPHCQYIDTLLLLFINLTLAI